ncbi:MAG: hypothetical protein ACRDAM_17275, partial [Casimicrobium sp.]
MTIKSLTYSEFKGAPNGWVLQPTDFGAINLVVGRNATGKTRLLNVVAGLCQILSGQLTQPLLSGTYSAEFEIDQKSFKYDLEYENRTVKNEQLLVDGALKLERDEQGKGRVHFEQLAEFVAFELSPELLAIQQKRDRLQHPFIEIIANWASKT